MRVGVGVALMDSPVCPMLYIYIYIYIYICIMYINYETMGKYKQQNTQIFDNLSV